MEALFAYFLSREKVGHGRLIAVQAQAADLAHAGGGGDALVPELLPLVDVGDMDLDAGHAHRLQGVQNGVGVVGVGSGIHDDGIILSLGGVDGVDDSSLMVGLEALRGGIVGGGKVLQPLTQALVGIFPINTRLPLAQQVQVGAVDNQKFLLLSTSKIRWVVSTGVGCTSTTWSAHSR